jgi:hypothetical protein
MREGGDFLYPSTAPRSTSSCRPHTSRCVIMIMIIIIIIIIVIFQGSRLSSACQPSLNRWPVCVRGVTFYTLPPHHALRARADHTPRGASRQRLPPACQPSLDRGPVCVRGMTSGTLRRVMGRDRVGTWGYKKRANFRGGFLSRSWGFRGLTFVQGEWATVSLTEFVPRQFRWRP